VNRLSDDKMMGLLMERAHCVETVIDVIKLVGYLSDKWREKLDSCHGNKVISLVR